MIPVSQSSPFCGSLSFYVVQIDIVPVVADADALRVGLDFGFDSSKGVGGSRARGLRATRL